jgi:hypothetical protein
VYIPAGTFLVSSRVVIPSKKNFTVRGAGMGVTKIITSGGIGSVFLFGNNGSNAPGATQAIVSGATKGSTTITVAYNGFYVGQPFEINHSTPPTWHHRLGGYPDSNAKIHLEFKILSKTSTTLSFDPPCPSDFAGATMIATAYNPVIPDRLRPLRVSA